MTKYILGVLLAIIISLSATTCHYRGETNRLEVEAITLEQSVKTWKEKTQEAIDREVQANTRCLISQQQVAITNDANASLDESKEMTLRELAKQPHDKLLETIIDANQKTKPVADDARLSPDVMRMLNAAYCAGAKDDPTCTAHRATKELPASKSGK